MAQVRLRPPPSGRVLLSPVGKHASAKLNVDAFIRACALGEVSLLTRRPSSCAPDRRRIRPRPAPRRSRPDLSRRPSAWRSQPERPDNVWPHRMARRRAARAPCARADTTPFAMAPGARPAGTMVASDATVAAPVTDEERLGYVPEPLELAYARKERPIARRIEEDLVADIPAGIRLVDPAITPSRSRLVPLADQWPDIPADMVPAAKMILNANGTPRRTFRGKLAHECGIYPSFVSHTTLPWEGITAFNFLQREEASGKPGFLLTESFELQFRLPGTGEKTSYYVDAERRERGRRRLAYEFKRSERDLADPRKRLKYACVKEILRRIDVDFSIVLGGEIFESRTHKDNCELVAMRRFVEPETPAPEPP